MKVYQSIGQVSAALSKEGISKGRQNQQQGYSFRGIDDCLNALAPLLSANNLVILPEVLERDVVERQTRQGGALFYVTVKVRYAFVNAEDDSRHDVVTYGEAMDSADKATNKAMSAAYKYAVIQAFCIPTEGDNDADAHTHDVAYTRAERVAQSFALAKAAVQSKIAELKQEATKPGVQAAGTGDGVAVSLAPGRTPQASDSTPGPNPAVSDEDWRLFVEYCDEDDDRGEVKDEAKKLFACTDLRKLPVVKRLDFILKVQDMAAKRGVMFATWVEAQ
jgi:hypothetical protein